VDSGEDLTLLVREQAALRRMATLVARGAPPAEIFATVISEVGRLGPADAAALSRYEHDDTLTTIGFWSRAGGYVAEGTRHPLAPGTLGRLVCATHRPARIESYAEVDGSLAELVRGKGWRSSVGAPILVDGQLWGVVGMGSMTEQPLPAGTEARLADFADLLATAVGNAQSRETLTRLAEEQAALRRVATLVANGAPPAEVFARVSSEVGRLIPADAAVLIRYRDQGTILVGAWDGRGDVVQSGVTSPLQKGAAATLVHETRRPSRVDSYDDLPASLHQRARDMGWRSAVGVPVIVEADLWGAVVVASTTDQQLPADTEVRLTAFTELLATAIANAESRAELHASRARVVATADATRRRIERNLHDGAQQRLVSLALELRAAQATVPPELVEHRTELAHVVEELNGVMTELREISRGIHPAILVEGGIGPALRTLARRSAIPVEVDVRVETRLPEQVEVAAYYVVSEALTNAAKYAGESAVRVVVDVHDDALHVVVRDDGPGGADPARGSGLLGLKDRAEAIGGTVLIYSPPGGGTSVQVEIPY
jgi:signal transduction histidine kinase